MKDSDELASMYAEIVRGASKVDSQYAGKDAKASATWDSIAAEVAELRTAHPTGHFSIPNELPELP